MTESQLRECMEILRRMLERCDRMHRMMAEINLCLEA